MNVKSLVLSIACTLILTSCAEENKVFLFNGENLDNWDKVLLDSITDPDEVFQVREGILWLSGSPYGYIATKDTYSNYKLHVEWRWPEEPANSGLFIHVQELNPDGWPVSVEAQLKHASAGDLICMGQGTGLRVKDSLYITLPEMRKSAKVGRFGDDNENPAGEWNVYEITCIGDKLKFIVNDVLQHEGMEATLTSGRIALQSEGGPIEFRNVYLIPAE